MWRGMTRGAALLVLLTVLGLGLMALSLQSCLTGSQARDAVNGVKTAAGIVDLPGVSEPALVSYLQGVEDRLAEISARKPPEAKLGWGDWLTAILGTGAASTGLNRIVEHKAAKRRGRRRLEALSPLVQVVDELVEQVPQVAPHRERLTQKVSAAKQQLVKAA